ncbi:MAG: hybrid sensor histidine kinase/response regulator [Pleurocapsa sp.]
MSEDKELQVRLQFLEEAQEYIDNMESGLLGLGAGKVNSQQMDGVLRAAHSIKGGAAMMGFQQLSHLAHRLEDFFKVLKIGKTEAVDAQLETCLLSGVDYLRQIIAFNRRQAAIDEQWLEQTVNPLFEQLHDRLGDPQPEDAAALLSSELGEDMSTLIFETEVEELLQQLESILVDPSSGNLAAELLEAAQELSGLGEMLELPAFAELCNSVIAHIETTPEQLLPIAETAVREWRRSQALVLIGQVDVIPNQLELDTSDLLNSQISIEAVPDSITLDSILEADNLEEQALDLFSSLESIIPLQESKIADSVVEPLAESQADDSTVSFTSITPSQQVENLAENTEPVTEKTIRVSLQQLNELSDLFGEIAIERNGLGLRLKSLHNLVNLLRQRIQILEQSNFKLRIAYDKVATENVTAKSATSETISDGSLLIAQPQIQSTNRDRQRYFDSLEMDSYSDIHLLSQEVMEKVVQIQEVAKDIEISLEDTDKNARQLNRATKQMQGTITRVRMRPISDLLSRFPRALRDLEMQYGKKVQLRIRGGSTLVDRSILEALNDPLLHLFRNAFDHGIESPTQRLASNKPEQGLITISASHRGNQTVITLSDDGGGIDVEKIKTKATSLGFHAEDLADASQEELLDLIFEPGFSTAEQVTDLSGRGVGMDVVRTNIEQVNGSIQVDTKLGIGTTFTIKVPFTLSIVRILLVESNGMLLAFPTNVVEEMLVLDPKKIVQQGKQEVLNWDGYMVRLIRLHKWLNLADSAYNAANELEANPTIEEPTVLMIAQDEDLVGIQVDRYWQEEEVTIRSVEGNIVLPPGFTGCTVLGDGRVVPLVDAIDLLNWIEEKANNNQTKSRRSQNINKQTLTALAKSKPIVMVVDDSINIRRFLTLTLEKANYQVEQAKDGQDALDKLKAGLTPQAIICDIEMPRLDGFGFLSRVKSERQHKQIPIVMLTSRSGDKHRRLAMNLGATEYFTKPFKEHTLIATLAKLIKTS